MPNDNTKLSIHDKIYSFRWTFESHIKKDICFKHARHACSFLRPFCHPFVFSLAFVRYHFTLNVIYDIAFQSYIHSVQTNGMKLPTYGEGSSVLSSHRMTLFYWIKPFWKNSQLKIYAFNFVCITYSFWNDVETFSLHTDGPD